MLHTLDRTSPAPAFSRLSVVADTAKIPKAAEVEQWLAAPPRFVVLFLPPSCPKASPSEQAFGEVHDKCTRTHTRKRIWALGEDVEQPLPVNGPWPYALSESY